MAREGVVLRMIIRPYSEDDFRGIVALVHSIQDTESWPIVYPGGWDKERIKQEFDPMKEYKDSLFLVSESQGIITGLIAGHDLEPFISNEMLHLTNKFKELGLTNSKFFYQRDIMIHKDFQRGFLGFRLFNELKKHAIEKGYNKLVTRAPPLNKRGIDFFVRVGYTEIFKDDNPKRVYFNMNL